MIPEQTPKFIQRLIELYENDTQPFRKVRRLIDLAEAIIKFHTVCVVSNYLEEKEIQEEVKGILGSGLKTPSLGIWAFFTEKIHPHIPQDHFFWKDFPEYFQKVLKPSTDAIIPVRNQYAHGSVPSEEECLSDAKKLWPFVEKILKGGVLGRDQFEISKEGKVTLVSENGRKLSLHPLLRFQKEHNDKEKKKSYSNVVLFYNDIRNGKAVTLLNYDEGIHLRDKAFMEDFLRAFPLPDWEKRATTQFKERIEELTENFKGRRKELADLKGFIRSKDKGHLMVWGPPGVGKSTLLARAVQELSWENIVGEIPADEKIKGIHVQEYFIRRGSRTDQQLCYLEMMGKGLEARFKTGIPLQGTTQQDTISYYWDRFRAISEKLQEKGEKLVLFLDGLDEGMDDLVRLIPTENYPQILTILASRDIPRSRTTYNNLNPETRKETTLAGLTKNDIRALLNEYVNKYDIEDSYIQAIAQRSEGNPLYLKLLCNTLQEGEVQLNNASQLPKEIGTFYETILKRFSALPQGEKVVDLLFLLTVAKDFLSADVVSSFLGITRIQAERVLEEASEVLYENPLTEDIQDYQLFHESLRDFFWAKYKREVLRLEGEILRTCRKWKELSKENRDRETIRYVLGYFLRHLHTKLQREDLESKPKVPRKFGDRPEKTELFATVLSPEFQKAQLDHLQFYEVPLIDSRITLEMAILDTAGDWGTSSDLHEILKTENLKTILPLILHAGKTGQSAQTDISIAFTWAKEGKVEDAMKRILVIQDEKKLFNVLCLILWIVAEEFASQIPKAKTLCEAILQKIDEKCPIGVVMWGEEDPLPLLAYQSCFGITEDRRILFKRAENEGKKKVTELVSISTLMEHYYYNPEASLESLVGALATAGNFSEALKYADEINKASSKASALGSIAGALANAGDGEHAKLIFTQALEVAERIIGDADGKAKALRSIAFALANAGDREQAKLVFTKALEVPEQIESAIDKSKALKSIAGALANTGDGEQAKLVFTKALEVAEQIKSAIDKSKALGSIARALATTGDLTQALEVAVADKVNYTYYKENALESIVGALANAGDRDKKSLFSKALEVAEQIWNSRDKANALGTIAGALANAGDVEQSKLVFSQALEVAKQIENTRSKLDVLGAIAGALANAGDVPQALEIAKQIEYADVKANSLGTIAGALTNAGDGDERSMFTQALEVAEQIRNARDKAKALRSIASALANAGDVEQSKLVFSQALEVAKQIENTRSKLDALGAIAGALANAGDVPQALEIAKQIEYADVKANALGTIAGALTNAGDGDERSMFTQALEVAEQIESAEYKADAIGTIAGALATAGYVYKEPLFRKALEVAEQIESAEYKANALGTIAGALGTAGEERLWKIWENHRSLLEVWSYHQSSYWKVAYLYQLSHRNQPEALSYFLRGCLLLPHQGSESYSNALRVITILTGHSSDKSYGKECLQTAQALGQIVGILEPTTRNDGGGYEAELAELKRLWEEEEITKKGYEKRLGELKGKYGVG